MKITFNVPGELSIEDADTFTKRIKKAFNVKILCNVSRVGFSDATISGMTAEGTAADVNSSIKGELNHVSWLRISC